MISHFREENRAKMVATVKMGPPVNLVHLVMLSREIKESPELPVYLVRLEIRVPR